MIPFLLAVLLVSVLVARAIGRAAARADYHPTIAREHPELSGAVQVDEDVARVVKFGVEPLREDGWRA